MDNMSYPWSWRATVVMVGDWVSDVLRDSASLIENLSIQVAAAHNYQVDRRNFAEMAALEIERMTGGDE